MGAPATVSAFLALVRKSGLLSEEALARLNDEDLPSEPYTCADFLVRQNLLTPFQAQHLLVGRYRGLVLGPYRVLRALGKGGMGVVLLADHVGLDRKVALKVLTANRGNEKLSLERFYREARAAAALDHPNIVRLHDVTQAGGYHFLVMEFVDGLDLQSLVAQAGPLHYVQAVNYVVQAAAGLQHAHEKGFVHRDIKPANLMLAKDGTVKILDMGLTRSVTNPKDDLTNRFEEDAVTGTADFISPEQALNMGLDARSDIYSLGATLFTLICGDTPFGGSTTQKLVQHQMTAPPDLCKRRASVPTALGAVVARMMAKAPRDRYQTAGEVIEALRPWLAPGADTAPVSVSTETPPPQGWGKVPEEAPPELFQPKESATGARRKRWIAGAAVLLVAAIGVILASGRGKKPAETVQTPPPDQVTESPVPNPGPVPSPAPGTPPVTPNPVPKVSEPSEVVAYRLDLSATKPFLHSNTGRTVGPVAGAPVTFSGAPEGWGTHSWLAECTHEFFAETRGGHTALGLRFTAKPANMAPAGMLFVGGIDVVPGRAYTLRVTYQTPGSFTAADVRVLEQQSRKLRIAGQNRLIQTNGEWTTLTIPYKNGNTDKIQIEFHHNGPLGAGNELYLRSLEVVEADPRPPG
jgi:serine/threonine protein kinase